MRILLLFLMTIMFLCCNPSTPQHIKEKYSGKWELIVSDSLKQLYPKKFKNPMLIELRRDLTFKVNKNSPIYPGSEGTWRGIEAEGSWVGYIDIDPAFSEESLWSYGKDTIRFGSTMLIFPEGKRGIEVLSLPNENYSLLKCIKRY